MKKFINDWVVALGGTTSYSGNRKTMYVKGLKEPHTLLEQFPASMFKIVIQ